MGNLIARLKQADDSEVFGQIDEREQAVIDRHRQKAPSGFRRRLAEADALAEIDTRRQQRAYAEKPPTMLAAVTVDLAKEMVANLGDRAKVLDTYRKMGPEQRQEALKLAPGIAQQLGDDRGGAVGRTLGAVSRGISSFSQPVMELAGKVTGTDWGGTPEEIAFIRQLEGVASQEFAPARPGDPWYQSYPLQATEMTVNAAPLIGGGIAGAALGKTGGQLLARGASAGVPLAKPTFQAIGAVGKAPKIIGLKGATTKGTMQGLGTVAGITATGFPQQYAQEIDQLKELGMQDGSGMQSLAVGTALVTSALEAIMPNPVKGILPAGSVSLKDGALKAARQYLWEASKKAPAEISEEYAQGLSSGLGKVVANWIDENAEEKTLSDAFKTSFEQGNAAIGPMAFMLGVPAVAGAGMSAARAQRLQQALAKGFVSEEDAKQLGIEGKNRKERFTNANAELEQLTKQPPDGGLIPTVGTTPDLPPSGSTGATPPALPGPTGRPPRLPGPTGTVPPTSQPPALPGPAQPTQPTQGKPPLPTPPAATQPGATAAAAPSGQTLVGTNSQGQQVFEDINGVRSVLDGNVRITEPVEMRPFRTPEGKIGYRPALSGERDSQFEAVPAEPTQTLPKPATPEVPAAEPIKQPTASATEPNKPAKPTEQPGWEIVEGSDSKLYRENQDPNLKPSQRISTRVAVDPSESVLATKDRFGKPVPPEILAARQEFVDKAKPGAEFEIKGFPGQTNKVLDDGTLLNSSGRKMGNVQSRANVVEPGQITFKETQPAVDPVSELGEEDTPKPPKPTATPIPAADEDTRGKGVQYHGARGPIKSMDEGYYSSDNIYGGEGTFYTTDAKDIASGYGRKKPNATVYQVDEIQPVKHYDMEQKQPAEEVAKLFGTLRGSTGDLVSDALDLASKDGKTSLVEVMDEIRNESSNYGLSKDVVQEIFSTARENLQDQGYGGMSHVGGRKTGRKPHTVKIYFEPHKQLQLTDKDGNVIKPVPVVDAAETPTTATVDAKSPELDVKQPELETKSPELPAVTESKWSSETRAKLEAVPALKGAKVETDEKAATVKVTRPDGLSTTIQFNADEELAAAAKERLRKPESVHGWYIRKPGEKQGRILIHSKANHTNILNHEVMHWLEDTGVVTKEEVEAMGGREAIAEKYGKWAEKKQRAKDNKLFNRIYDALEPVFSSQARFFEEVGARKAAKPQEDLSKDKKPSVPTDEKAAVTEREPNVSRTGTEREQPVTPQASADQVNVDSGEESKVKPEDELASLRAKSDEMYDEVERLQNAGKDREANALLREAEKLTPRIKELEAPLVKARQEDAAAKEEERRKAYNAKEDARKAALPTKQTRNGWELATDGARWYLRDPNTKEIIYEGKMQRVRAVADESPPDAPSVKPELAPDTARIQAERDSKEQAKTEQKQRVAPEGYALLPEKTRTKFEAAWDGTDQQAMKDLLGIPNKALRAEFERRSDIKLPKTIKGTEEVVDEVYAARTKQQEKVRAERDAKLRERLKTLDYDNLRKLNKDAVIQVGDETISDIGGLALEELNRRMDESNQPTEEVEKDEQKSNPYPERPNGETGDELIKRIAGREWHEVTKADFLRWAAGEYIAGGARKDKLVDDYKLGTEEQRRKFHEKAVTSAIKEGKSVPPQVLADYPQEAKDEPSKGTVEVVQILKNAVRFSVNSQIPSSVPQTRSKRTDGVEYIEVTNPNLDSIPNAKEAIALRKQQAEKDATNSEPNKYGNTPIGKLFAEAKAAGGDTMLFFRMGDFYELYFEDAQQAAKMLGLTLTTRDKAAENPIPMAGFPYHQLDGYLKKLKSAGIRVAVNEEPFVKPKAKAKTEDVAVEKPEPKPKEKQGEERIPVSGEPFTFTALHNKEKSPNMGARFGQDKEPAGRYVVAVSDDNTAATEMPDKYDRKTVTFKNPLVIEFGGGYQEPTNWKQVLSDRYGGLTGKALSDAVRKDGYDGIVTVEPAKGPNRPAHTAEIIELEAGPVAPTSEPVAQTQVQADFMEMSNGVNAPGVKQTIRVTAGERTLLMEKGKADNEWSIREGEKYTGEVKGKAAVKKGGELIVSGIVETKKAKDIAQRIIDGTFDKDSDKRFVREDTQNIGLTNAGIAESMKDSLQRRDSFAKLLREEGLVTDGRFLLKVSDKDRDAILKAVGQTFEGKPLTTVAQMMTDGRKALSRQANAMKPIGYRGGYLTPRTVVLQSQDGDAAICDKTLHDTILKKYPKAVPYFMEDGKPISYAIDGDIVAIVMPMNMDKPDAKLKDLVAGKYDFEAEAAEADKFPPPQSKTKLKQAAEKANKEPSKEDGDNGSADFGKDVGNTLGITATGVPLAGQHRGGMGRSIQHFFQRFFTTPGELPLAAYDAKVRKEGRVAREMNRLRQRAADFRRAIKKALRGRELTQADIERMNAVLRGEESPSTLPVEMRAPIKAMRDHIDALSSQLILEGVAQGDLVGIITESMGVYATRSYRVFDNPKWRDQVPEAVRNRAIAAIRSLDPSKSDAEVAGILESLLYRGAADTPVALLKGSKLGSKDLSTFMVRKDIPEWLRELWGEYKDAGVNYARSVFKMAHLLANQQFLNEVREAGLGKWLRTEEEGPIVNEYGEIITPIAAESSSVMEPLNGLLTTPEIKKAFERFDSPGAQPEWLRILMGLNYAVKYGKTVGSLMTHVRNMVSNTGFAVANGHWRLDKAGNALWGTATGTFQLSNEKFREYYNRLAELGIVGEDVRAGELKDALRDASHADIDEFLYNREARHAKKLVGVVRAGFRFVNSLYQAEDAVWKIYAWENEKARYSKAHPEWSEQQVEEHAAKIVRNTYPTYSKIPEAVKALRRFPVLGTFVSFPSEVVRTTFHTIKLGMEEMQAKETRAIGAQRLAGTVASIGILSVLSRAMMAMFGIDDDEDEDLRWFVPPWQENSRFVYLNKPKDATYHFVDLGYSDPHAYLTDAVVAFMRGKDWKDSLVKSTSEFLGPFASQEILFKAGVEAVANEDQKIYNEHDEIGEQAKGIVAHMWTKAFEPGTFASGRRIITALQGTDPSKSVRDEVLAITTGQRLQKVDVEHSLGFRVRDFGKALTQIQGIARKTATSRGTATGAMVALDLARMEKLRLAAFAEMQQIAGAARRLGVPEESIRTLLNAELPDDVAEQLMTGDYSSYEMTPQTVRQMMNANPEEFKQRFEAWNGQKTPEAIRSYIGPRLGGLDKDSDLGKIKSELNMLGVTFEESKQSLKDYWKAQHGSAFDEKGVLKEAVKNRETILRKIYTSK